MLLASAPSNLGENLHLNKQNYGHVGNLHESIGRDRNTNEENRKKTLFLHAFNGGGGGELVIPTESVSKQ